MMRLLRSYFFWSYDRGSIQYDVMVTAILLFIFVAPRFIDFKDKPAALPLSSNEVLVKTSATNGHKFVYEVRIDDLGKASSDVEIKAALLRVIEPISGEVSIEGYQPVMDTKGKVVAYEATVQR